MKTALIEYHRWKAAQHRVHPDGTPKREDFHERAVAWLESLGKTPEAILGAVVDEREQVKHLLKLEHDEPPKA